jgi:putative phosphonate metabolism protein
MPMTTEPSTIEMNGSASRYGIYFCPSPSASLYGQGSEWLGRDAQTGATLDPHLPESIRTDDWLKATDSPRRYGFHATLKPPFRLADGVTFDDLRAELHEFALKRSCFHAPVLRVGALGRFLALILSSRSEEFDNLAADCVGEFDRFRAPAGAEETAKRLHDSLTPREREHVLRWGYPYVFDTWKFHMSLTRSLPTEQVAFYERYLGERFAGVCEEPLLVDSICIFHESRPGASFHLLDRAYLRTA